MGSLLSPANFVISPASTDFKDHYTAFPQISRFSTHSMWKPEKGQIIHGYFPTKHCGKTH